LLQRQFMSQTTIYLSCYSLLEGERISYCRISQLPSCGASLAVSLLLKGFLFGLSATDPMTFGIIPPLLAAIALLACYVPARRAAKVDPMVALRNE
jgi:hypothetical protein